MSTKGRNTIPNWSRWILLVSFVCATITVGYAQKRYPYWMGWRAQFYLGSTNFKGDLRNNHNGFIDNSPLSKFFYQDRRMLGGIRVEKSFTNIFSVSGQMHFGSLAGTNDFELMNFKANIFEYSLQAHLSLTDMFWGHDKYRRWNAYTYLGIGFNESRTWRYSTLGGNLIGTNGFREKRSIFFMRPPMTETVVPLGVGVSYNLYENMDLAVEYSYHFVNTDKLDDLISDRSGIEGYSLISTGLYVRFQTPKNWSLRRGLPSYTGKSSDPAIKAYNKRKRVVMTNKRQHRLAAKKRYTYKRKRFKRKRKLRLSR